MSTWLYRPMRADADGLPACGSSSLTLGARPDFDLPVSPTGQVQPETGGMSVTPDDITRIPRHVKPKKLGGRGMVPVFRIGCDALPNALVYVPDASFHGTVQPALEMAFVAYQAHLHASRGAWEEVAI